MEKGYLTEDNHLVYWYFQYRNSFPIVKNGRNEELAERQPSHDI
jgi:hypothetical protein